MIRQPIIVTVACYILYISLCHVISQSVTPSQLYLVNCILKCLCYVYFLYDESKVYKNFNSMVPIYVAIKKSVYRFVQT